MDRGNHEISKRDFLKMIAYGSASVLAPEIAKGETKENSVEYPFEEVFGPRPGTRYYFEDTGYFFSHVPPHEIFDYIEGFKKTDKPLDEPLRHPEDTTDELIRNSKYDKNGNLKISEIEISPTDFAFWLCVSSIVESSQIPLYVGYLDVDGEGEAEELTAFHEFRLLENKINEMREIEDHIKFFKDVYISDKGLESKLSTFSEFLPREVSRYLVSYGYPCCLVSMDLPPKDVAKDSSGLQKLLYYKSPDEVDLVSGKATRWINLVDKTPQKLGLDKIDTYETPTEVPENTTTPKSKTPLRKDNNLTSSTPSNFSNKEIPGFEAGVFPLAIGSALYIYKKLKN